MAFLISDFICDSAYEKPLNVLGRRHDLIAVSVKDPREAALPDAGLMVLKDAETGRQVVIDTGSRAVRRRYAALAAAQKERLTTLLRSRSIDHIEITTGADHVRELVKFFRTRERRR